MNKNMSFKWNLAKRWIALRRIYRSHKRQIICAEAACLCCVFFVCYYIGVSKLSLRFQNFNTLTGMQLARNLLHEKGCDLPKLDPFSEEAMAYSQGMKNPPAVVCNGGPDWVTCRKSECFLKDGILNTFKNIECTYMDIIYETDDSYYMGKPVKVWGDDKYLLNRSDHVKISCISLDEEKTAVLPQRWRGHKAGFRPIPLPPRSTETNNSLNILILAIDSTSHNGFIRGMPKSYKYLKEEIKAVFLNGHNIAGDGTPAALFPIMTGKEDTELPDRRKMFGSKEYFDHKNFIFHHVKENGYRTAYFEDMPWVGTFQYRYNGFNQQPADHYLRAFLLEESLNRKNWFGKYRFRHCIGSEPSYQLLLNLTAEFMQLEGKKFIFTLMVDLAHDDFNLLPNGDNDTLRFLQTFVEKDMMKDTLLIVMGDHGSRYEGIRHTHQGRIEERLPLMAISLPERLKQQRPEALEALEHNKDVLTTHFDIHTTLLDVLNLKEYSNKHTMPGAGMPRALSLLKKIPKARSCSDAGILPHWCVCLKWYNVSRSDAQYQKVGNFLADYINRMTNMRRDKCVKRKLTSIEWVMKQIPIEMPLSPLEVLFGKLDRNTLIAVEEYYQAKIIMSPGEALFEGTLTYSSKSNSFHVTERDISRIDLYGNESECIRTSDAYLLKYCYCNDKIPSKRDGNSILRHFLYRDVL